MSYQVLKLIVYVFSVLSAMYGLSCFHYEKYILKGKLKQFYCLYIIVSLSLGYLLASFILDFVTIHFNLSFHILKYENYFFKLLLILFILLAIILLYQPTKEKDSLYKGKENEDVYVSVKVGDNTQKFF